MSDRHWSRARAGTNEEALAYYRQRSKAPGVAEGGAARNYYCMRCDGVIAFDHAGTSCPHCGAPLEGQSKRYFNWVEINEPPASDFRSLLPFLVGGLVALVLAGLLVWRILR
jgi:ribosomal protein L37E